MTNPYRETIWDVVQFAKRVEWLLVVSDAPKLKRVEFDYHLAKIGSSLLQEQGLSLELAKIRGLEHSVELGLETKFRFNDLLEWTNCLTEGLKTREPYYPTSD